MEILRLFRETIQRFFYYLTDNPCSSTHSVEEIARIMNSTEPFEEPASLRSFARTVAQILDVQ
jgi:hypothetical protein